jgi:GMP synthase-like glutamine amidotransferase
MLNAETPVAPVLEQRGSFGTIFHNLLRTAAARVSPDINVESTEYDVKKGQYPPDLSTVDVVLITGSASSAYDDLEWVQRLGDFVLDTYLSYPHVKFFGSCFGHQLICQSLLQAYGIRVDKDPKGFENGVQEITLTESFRNALQVGSKTSAFGAKENDTKSIPKTLRLQMVHGDQVVLPSPDALPSTWSNIGGTKQCAVQGVYQPGRVLTLQGHFEFDRFVNGETLKVFAGPLNWTPEMLQNYLELVDADDDSELAADMVMRFFLEKTTSISNVATSTVSGLLTPPMEEE